MDFSRCSAASSERENSDLEQKARGLQTAKDGVSDRNENMLLETGRGQAMLVIKWPKTKQTWPNCVCVLVFVEGGPYKR